MGRMKAQERRQHNTKGIRVGSVLFICSYGLLQKYQCYVTVPDSVFSMECLSNGAPFDRIVWMTAENVVNVYLT